MTTRRPVGVAACTWGLEPGYAFVPERDPDEVPRLAARIGFDGIEPATLSGPGVEIRSRLDGEGLACPARFVGLSLANRDAALGRGLEALDDLVVLGGRVLLIGIEEAGDVSVLSELERACRSAGVFAAVHPEVGGPVARASEVDALLRSVKSLGVCLDTGHFWAAGDKDLVGLIHGWREQLVHVHLKDVRESVATSLRAGEMSVEAAVGAGLWQPLGAGDVPFSSVLRGLDEIGYDGWLIVEHDFAPDPDESARSSFAWLRRQYAETGGP